MALTKMACVRCSRNALARHRFKVLDGQRQAKATLAIGPEGGWTDFEFETSRRSGFQEVSLGKLILRTETAVIAALASMNYALNGE